MIDEYDLVDGPQFGLLDSQTGNPYMSYYITAVLDQAFPPGSVLLPTSSTDSGIVSLAAKAPDGTTSILVVNRKLASNTVHSSCGTGGVATTVNISLPFLPSTASLEQLNKANVTCSTNFAVAPVAQTVTPSQTVSVNFPGYGLAILTVKP